jgi:hypothetical protein
MTMVRDIAEVKEANWKPKLKAGYYHSAPHCFLLRVDDSIFIEQYHYGKLRNEQIIGRRVVLGKDLPLAEYIKEPSDLFEQTRRTAFALLESHLDFIREQADLFEIDEWLPLASVS